MDAPRTIVLGAGGVGSAAVWDLVTMNEAVASAPLLAELESVGIRFERS